MYEHEETHTLKEPGPNFKYVNMIFCGEVSILKVEDTSFVHDPNGEELSTKKAWVPVAMGSYLFFSGPKII